jgi:hypothetical protein
VYEGEPPRELFDGQINTTSILKSKLQQGVISSIEYVQLICRACSSKVDASKEQ